MAEKKRGTIRPSLDVYESHNDRRKQLGMSWDEYLEAESAEIQHADVNEAEVAAAVLRGFEYEELAALVADELETRLG